MALMKVSAKNLKLIITDKLLLQKGAKMFMNYCYGCHSLKYARYNRVARDLGIPEDLFQENLIFGDQKIGDLMYYRHGSSLRQKTGLGSSS